MQIFIQIFLVVWKRTVFFAFLDNFEYNGYMFYFCHLRMKYFRNVCLIILWIVLVFFVWNWALAKNYEYTNLDIQADVKIDGSIDVTETFTTNFLKKKRGIVRFIPLNYTVEDTDFRIKVDHVRVDWNKFTTYIEDGGMNIKIWDPDVEIKWEKIYPISYSVYWLIRNFAWMWYHELYWNIVWYDFDTNINKVRAEIKLPKKYNSFTNEDFLITTDWKTIRLEEFDWMVDWSAWDKIIMTYNKKLRAGEWITLAIKFPKDYFELDHDRQASLLWHVNQGKNQFNITEYGWFEKTLIFIVWFLIFSFWMKFIFNTLLYKKITPAKIWKDFERKYPVIIQYNPPKWMNSAEAGLLFNCRVDPVDITSLIYQWASNNFIFIDYQSKSNNSKKIKSITLIKKSDIPVDYPYYEKDLFNNIFGGKRSKVIDKHTNLSRLFSLESLEDYWLRKHWLCRKKTSFFWNFIYFGLYILLLYLLFHYFWWLWILFLIFFTPIIFGLFFKQNNKIKMTDEWAKLAAHVIWYAKFIKECDEKILKTFLKEDPLFVDKTLPYAVAFGMESLFLKKITPLVDDMEKSWLTWNLVSVWNIISFVKADSLFMQSNWFLFNPFFFLSGGESWGYDSIGWFSSWSSFWWWFSSWWWGWWWGSRSW